MIPADAMREAVEAARLVRTVEAMTDADGSTYARLLSKDEIAAAMLTAALPIVEGAIRAQVAGEIAEAISESLCGEEAWRREDPEGYAQHAARMRDVGIKVDDHEPIAYSPYCDGCASASAANRTRAEVLRLVTHGPELARGATTTPSAGTGDDET